LGEKRTALTVFMCPVSVNINSTRVGSSGGTAGGAAAVEEEEEEEPPPPPPPPPAAGADSNSRQIFTSLSAPAVAKMGNTGWKSIDRRGSFLEPVFACHVIWSVFARNGMAVVLPSAPIDPGSIVRAVPVDAELRRGGGT
jgi:hypothetical protein